MSTLSTTNLKHASSASNNIVLDSSGRALIGVSSANANGGILQLSSGITFPATQVLSTDPNTLDDYEEGTWTPTIIGSSTAGTGTYTSQVGRYTKFGNRVQFTAYIVWTAHTGSGAMRVSALPFTSNSTTDNYNAVALWHQNITLSANHVLTGYVNAGSTYIALAQVPTGGGAGATVPLDAAGDIMVSGCYEV